MTIATIDLKTPNIGVERSQECIRHLERLANTQKYRNRVFQLGRRVEIQHFLPAGIINRQKLQFEIRMIGLVKMIIHQYENKN